MLWPIVLPFKITFWVLASLLAAAVLAAPMLKQQRSRVFLWGFPMALMAFVPSCSMVMSVLDRSRFGVFDYNTFADIEDIRVATYLPPTARNITVDKAAQGFRARYQVEPDVLEDWFDQMWTQYGDQSVSEQQTPSFDTMSQEQFELEFSGLGWPRPDEVTTFEGPVAGDGAGFTIWYDAENGMAYERGNYF